MSAQAGATVVVLGTMGTVPFAGMGWQVLHHLDGLRQLGCDVHYVEDSGAWAYDPVRATATDDPRSAIRFIAGAMAWAGLDDRWTYCSVGARRETYGHSDRELASLLRRADAIINLTGATVLREEHMQVPIRVYLETDPGLPQFGVASGHGVVIRYLDAHTHHLTYAANLGREECRLPEVPYQYRATRPPVVVEWWDAPPPQPAASFTTVGNWRQSGKDVEWDGTVYTWSKHHEFMRVIDLPRRVSRSLELALSSYTAEDEVLLTDNGWRILDALTISTEMLAYHSYIRGSWGELTVAKDQNVRTRSGWFSDRSVCYLAAGRPVITQDTGFGADVPTGEGLLAFLTVDEAVEAVEAVERDYPLHAKAAREIAHEYFGAEKLMGDVLGYLGLS